MVRPSRHQSSLNPKPYNVPVVGLLAVVILIAVSARLMICTRRMNRNREAAMWQWFEGHHDAIMAQHQAQAEILGEIADNVIYLADYRTKKG